MGYCTWQAESTRASARAKGLSRGETPVKLTYSFSVEHESITTNYGVLDDLVLASDDELYVTQASTSTKHYLYFVSLSSSLVAF